MTFKDVELLIERKGVTLANKRVQQIREKVRQVVTSWRLEVKFNLSRKWTGGRSTGFWPMLRSGRLSKSVPTYDVNVKKTFSGFSIGADQAVIQLKQRNLREPWNTYGDDLHLGVVKTLRLTGWKDRAYALLNNRLWEKIKGLELMS